jgi:Holliday junction resolvasome RuvABC endonuclease subunit
MAVRHVHYVLGVDPGLASTGYALCAIEDDDLRACKDYPKTEFHENFVVMRAGVLRTKKTSHKQLRVCDDRVARVCEMLDGLREVRSSLPGESVLWCAEEFTCYGRPTTNAALYTSVVFGAVMGLARSYGDSFLPVRPSEAKKFVTGLKTATKEMMYELVHDRVIRLGKWPASCNEHVADACACAFYGVYSYADLLTYLKMF